MQRNTYLVCKPIIHNGSNCGEGAVVALTAFEASVHGDNVILAPEKSTEISEPEPYLTIPDSQPVTQSTSVEATQQSTVEPDQSAPESAN